MRFAAMERERIEAAILALTAARGSRRSICPSEAARALAQGGDWRALMPAVREAAAGLAARGALRVTQKGVAVDARTARGPIRLAAPDAPDDGD
ncbi:MAG: DUF3253 domain-containing protein [Rubrimonas sp.]